MQGEVFHWTVALGSGLTEACNFYTSAAGATSDGAFHAWLEHMGMSKSRHASIATAEHLANVFRTFGVLGARLSQLQKHFLHDSTSDGLKALGSSQIYK